MDSRTPQNTPANNAPISSKAQAPGVASIKEGEHPATLGLRKHYPTASSTSQTDMTFPAM